MLYFQVIDIIFICKADLVRVLVEFIVITLDQSRQYLFLIVGLLCQPEQTQS